MSLETIWWDVLLLDPNKWASALVSRFQGGPGCGSPPPVPLPWVGKSRRP